jgi:hypothetical protein
MSTSTFCINVLRAPFTAKGISQKLEAIINKQAGENIILRVGVAGAH